MYVHTSQSIYLSPARPSTNIIHRYQHLDNQKQKQLAAKATAKSFEDVLHARVASFSEGSELSWIYENDIEDVWKNWLAENVKSGRRRRDEGGISPNL